MKKAAAFFLMAMLSVQGCTYAISPNLTAKADRTITFDMIAKDPAAFKGKLIIVGGTIASLKNVKNETYLEVAQKELDYWGRPKRTESTSGSFVVYTPAYLDSWVYTPGRDITVAAEVAGTERKAVGETGYKDPIPGSDFKYPLLISKELKLWDRPDSSRKEPMWWDPLNDPYGRERTTRP